MDKNGVGFLVRIGVLLLAIVPAASATETLIGQLKQVVSPICSNNCGDYYLIPDSTSDMVYMSGVQLSGYVDHHVQVVGARASCGGCISFIISQITVVPETGVGTVPEEIPLTTALDQNYPNPFNPSTSIRYTLSSDGFVVLRLINVLGETVETLVSAPRRAGVHTARWDASAVPGGVYFCLMTFDGGAGRRSTSSRKLLLIR